MIRLRRLGVIGGLVFLAGVAVAVLRLPEWRVRPVPEQELFAARLREVAARGDLAVEAAPRLELRSKSWLDEDGNLGMTTPPSWS